MQKKILLTLLAVLAVVGGIAALSAYEAHVINVTAHIENALSVTPEELMFGTVFPQEWLTKEFDISLSDSFLSENRVDDVEYIIARKPKPLNPEDWKYCLQNPTDYTRCYRDLCAFLSVTTTDSNDVSRESYYTPKGCITPGEARGRLAKSETDISDSWVVDLKVPPVAGYVGQDWPANCPTISEDSKDYGCDLWIEVTGISENGGCVPTTEICDDHKDNDCDGYVDCDDPDCSGDPNCEFGECETGETRPCPLQTGVCTGVIQTCVDGYWSSCDYGPDYEQGTEVSCDGKDNDCDGVVDENLTRSCPLQLGVCAGATQACTAGSWSTCDYGPYYESGTETTCNDMKDNDCDGLTDCDDGNCFEAPACTQTPSRFEYYNKGNDDRTGFFGNYWEGQTFTPQTAHKIKSVRLKMYRIGSPGDLFVKIRATDGSGKPTGPDLASGSIGSGVITLNTNGAWYEILLGVGANLSAGTKYALVFSTTGGSWPTNALFILYDSTSPTYAGGSRTESDDAGVNWVLQTGNDIMFEEWGI